MLLPNKTKYRKAQKGGKKITGVANSGCYLAFGMYGLKSLSSGRLKSNQIEAARRSISKNLKREGKLFIRVFLLYLKLEKAPTYIKDSITFLFTTLP